MATKRSLLKLLAITACSLTFATTLSVGIANSLVPQAANAYEITLDSADALEESYLQGTTLTIPTGTIDGAKATRYVVIAPSGNGYNSNTITLTEAGKYTIKWYATVGGKEVFAEKTFKVAQTAVTLENKAEYKYMENLSK